MSELIKKEYKPCLDCEKVFCLDEDDSYCEDCRYVECTGCGKQVIKYEVCEHGIDGRNNCDCDCEMCNDAPRPKVETTTIYSPNQDIFCIDCEMTNFNDTPMWYKFHLTNHPEWGNVLVWCCHNCLDNNNDFWSNGVLDDQIEPPNYQSDEPETDDETDDDEP